MKILLVEDDADTRSYVSAGLQARGHSVDESGDGNDGLLRATQHDYDVIVLDRMLPARDGMSVLRNLRSCGTHAKVLMLTALGDVDARIEGMEAGADDYLGKPFALNELIARLNAISRRGAHTHTLTCLRIGDMELDLILQRVHRGERQIHLHPREWDLLKFLALHADEVVTRAMLLEHVWGYQSSPHTNLVDTHVCRLRGKIERDFLGPRMLRTIRGEGYMLSAKRD
ncbi:response regulator transcription factor [Dyella nitratireducens]|uniref:DNA-binding response regulator n=1 Tax=Dyella nitratireducens TaxID=1849580 RepID=A0ABQ1FVN5_9GAMM|nr:response regulator transcription factor [Dyella nitratireducens]GGA31701.1 DNA-binding response regulator [Dyella nitratireducens]GLQ42833.1 DNA-binding response regulator [Dyella nitratireducens]